MTEKEKLVFPCRIPDWNEGIKKTLTAASTVGWSWSQFRSRKSRVETK
jgi:hypothetical protein